MRLFILCAIFVQTAIPYILTIYICLDPVLVLTITGIVSLRTMPDDERVTNMTDEWVEFGTENVEEGAYILIDSNRTPTGTCFYLPDAMPVCTESRLVRI